MSEENRGLGIFVEIEDEWQLSDEAKEQWYKGERLIDGESTIPYTLTREAFTASNTCGSHMGCLQ